MKRRIYPNISLMAIVLIIATACMSDVTDEQFPGTGYFTIDVSMGKLSTRAVSMEAGDADGDFNENVISSLDIFFYEGNTLKWHTNSLSYDAGTQKAIIPVISDKRALFENNTTNTYNVYVVANNTADIASITEGANNLSALKDLIFQTGSFVTGGGGTAQSSLVMDGVVSKVVNLNDPDLGTVYLKRAASKIRLRLIEVNVPGYTQEGEASAQLVHFTDQSALMEGGTVPVPGSSDWKETSPRSMSTAANDGEITTAAPFYAYANDWSSIPANETYLELYVPLKNENDEVQTYKYRVPVTPRGLTGDEAQYMNKLQRNFLYDIGVTVKVLGSREEPPVVLSGNYTIKDWGTQEVLVNITGAHYLVVSERQVIMPNRTGYTLNFNSSIPNVTLVENSLKATYTYVDVNTGQPVTANVTSDQMPRVSVQPTVAAGTISINSSIPINFIPKDIEFKVTNGTLTETVTIQQLPATYYTTERGYRSNLRNQLDAAHNNPYMYMITTLAPEGDIIWGFPPPDANGNTTNSTEVANMVSPRFMMASQFGATSPMNYNNAVTNCQDYWEETSIGGTTVRYSDWRLPTEAEIKYIDDLQHNSNNPQGIVMRGNYYWDAYSVNNAYRMKNPVTTSASATSAHVRCIRDIKD